MKKYPNVHTLEHLLEHANESHAGLPDGRYVPSRPEGFASLGSRLHCAWLVFTGYADALIWPGGQ